MTYAIKLWKQQAGKGKGVERYTTWGKYICRAKENSSRINVCPRCREIPLWQELRWRKAQHKWRKSPGLDTNWAAWFCQNNVTNHVLKCGGSITSSLKWANVTQHGEVAMIYEICKICVKFYVMVVELWLNVETKETKTQTQSKTTTDNEVYSKCSRNI